MDYKKAVEIYTNIENIDMFNDVKLQDDGEGVFVKEWTISEVVKPTVEQLINIYNANETGINRVRELQTMIISAGNTIQQTLRQNTYDVLGEFIADIISNAENEIKTIEANYSK